MWNSETPWCSSAPTTPGRPRPCRRSRSGTAGCGCGAPGTPTGKLLPRVPASLSAGATSCRFRCPRPGCSGTIRACATSPGNPGSRERPTFVSMSWSMASRPTEAVGGAGLNSTMPIRSRCTAAPCACRARTPGACPSPKRRWRPRPPSSDRSPAWRPTRRGWTPAPSTSASARGARRRCFATSATRCGKPTAGSGIAW